MLAPSIACRGVLIEGRLLIPRHAIAKIASITGPRGEAAFADFPSLTAQPRQAGRITAHATIAQGLTQLLCGDDLGGLNRLGWRRRGMRRQNSRCYR